MPCRITGQERRTKKKELSLLKRDIHTFWDSWQINDDMYRCYGHHFMSREEAAKSLLFMVDLAKVLKKELADEVTG